MDNLIAQSLNIGGANLEGPLDKALSSSGGQITLGDIINRILVFILPLAGIILLFVLIAGGFEYMVSQGNPEKIKSAQAKITTGVIGFFLLISSYLIVRVISAIFGFDSGII